MVQKLCDLIEDQATSANDMSFDSQELKQLVKNLPPFTGVDSRSLTAKLDEISLQMISSERRQSEKFNA